jgi:citrate lyase subunit beta/citryl-CoA lyase
MAAPRSYLFVPATRLELLAKARRSGVEAIIVDLEDAVKASDKSDARAMLTTIAPDISLYVRINGRHTVDYRADLQAVANSAFTLGVIIPKVESAIDVAATRAELPDGLALLALIETAKGVLASESIAHAGVDRIIFGCADFVADIKVPASKEVLALPRSQLVLASRAAGLPPPVDGPTMTLDDLEAVRADATEAKALGMGAKLCVHPVQVPVVHNVFQSSSQEREWALSVLAAAELLPDGAFAFEGSMVDEPVLKRARQMLEES